MHRPKKVRAGQCVEGLGQYFVLGLEEEGEGNESAAGSDAHCLGPDKLLSLLTLYECYIALLSLHKFHNMIKLKLITVVQVNSY